jgi:hemolysin-activating ACP:hemolysin acyltransferase
MYGKTKRFVIEKEKDMKHYFPALAAVAVSFIGSAIVPALQADQSNKKTEITTNHPIAVEGTVLPPGSYVIKVLVSSLDQSVVQIFDSKNHLATTVFPVRAYRVKATDRTQITFYEGIKGQPPALRTWFYSGENDGFEFRHVSGLTAGLSTEGAAE